MQVAGERYGLVHPVARIEQVALFGARGKVIQGVAGGFEFILLSPDSAICPHEIVEFGVELVGVFVAVGFGVSIVFCLPFFFGAFQEGHGEILVSGIEIFEVGEDAKGSEFSAGEAREESVGSESVGAVILIFAFTRGKESGDVGLLVAGGIDIEGGVVSFFVVDPESTHGVVDGGIYAHGSIDWIFAHEFLVDFEDATELIVNEFGSHAEFMVQVGDIEIDLLATFEAFSGAADAVDDEADEVAAEEIAVDGVEFFGEVPTIGVGDFSGMALIIDVARYPESPALSADGFGHESAFVFAGDGGWVDLHHFGVSVMYALLVADGNRRAGIDDGVGGSAEDDSVTAGTHDHGVGRERFDGHVTEVLGDNAFSHVFRIFDEANEIPAFIFFNGAAGFKSPDLFIEGVEKLLSGSGSRISSSVLECSAESPEREESFGGAIERDAHSVEEVDDGGGAFGHSHDRGLVVEEVAAGDGVFKVEVGGVTFSTEIDGAVDSALRANAMAPFDGDKGEELYLVPGFCELHGGHETGEASSNYDNCPLRCHGDFLILRMGG